MLKGFKQKQSGFSAVEILGVIILIVIMSLAGMFYSGWRQSLIVQEIKSNNYHALFQMAKQSSAAAMYLKEQVKVPITVERFADVAKEIDRLNEEHARINVRKQIMSGEAI
jgi:hypothetical protein